MIYCEHHWVGCCCRSAAGRSLDPEPASEHSGDCGLTHGRLRLWWRYTGDEVSRHAASECLWLFMRPRCGYAMLRACEQQPGASHHTACWQPNTAAAHSGQPPVRRRSTAGGCTRCATCSSSCPSRCSAARGATLTWCRRRATRCGCASTPGSGAIATLLPLDHDVSLWYSYNTATASLEIWRPTGWAVTTHCVPDDAGAPCCVPRFHHDPSSRTA